MPYKDKQKQREANSRLGRKYRDQRRELLDSLQADGCFFCGEKEKACLDFHHLNPMEKDFNVRQKLTMSIDRLLAEAAKCIVVCANCHRKIHAGLLTLP